MLKFLSVIVMFVGIMAVCAEGESKAVLTRDYGVKLCGREFIRAVIFTCGGSRWRRSGDLDSVQSSERNPFQISPDNDLLERDRLSWLQSRLTAAGLPQKPTSALGDLLNLLGDMSDFESGAELDQAETPQWEGRWEQGRLPRVLGGNPKIPWPRPKRQKRNFSLGLAGMCCNQGCTKNDIGRLC